MNKILKLFSEKYVVALFKEQLLPLYLQYQDIADIEITPYKKMIWTSTYHVVIRFNVNFVKPDLQKEQVLVVCSAHSNEERKNVFQAMNFLWKNNFNRGHIDIPRPLFYSSYFQGTFYEGITGENLMYYIKNKDYTEIESILHLSAELFARLHALPAVEDANFNPKNSRIKTVVPGVENILKEMSHRFDGKFSESFQKIYKYLIEKEEKFLAEEGFKFSLIHGDAHTENVIYTGENRVGLIDFTDFCLGDCARDIGTFMQQLEYKISAKRSDSDYAKQMSELFLSSYLLFSKQEDSANLRERIALYYNWTAIRTVVYLFLKHDSNPEGAENLLNKIKVDLNL